MYRYYLTQRPPMPGAFPRFAANVVAFDDRKEVPNLASNAWGYVEYEAPLTQRQIRDYELMETGPFYMERTTGAVFSEQMMLKQFREEYDGDDPLNDICWAEYFEEVL